jgi:hypothetical protein
MPSSEERIASETLVLIRATRRNIREDGILHKMSGSTRRIVMSQFVNLSK